MGIPEGQPDSADNVKAINNTKSIDASFRNPVLTTVHVDFTYTGTELGTEAVPNNTPAEAVVPC